MYDFEKTSDSITRFHEKIVHKKKRLSLLRKVKLLRNRVLKELS
jgi:hypothetical protein